MQHSLKRDRERREGRKRNVRNMLLEKHERKGPFGRST
jgi:hypothetical protein